MPDNKAERETAQCGEVAKNTENVVTYQKATITATLMKVIQVDDLRVGLI